VVRVMGQHNDRIQELLEASIQIADHMKESGQAGQQIEQLKQLLHTQVQQSIGNGGDSAWELHGKLVQAEQLLEGLERHAEESYEDKTGGDTAEYEAKSLYEQQQYVQAYHEKIDYLSLKKIRNNLDQIRIILH